MEIILENINYKYVNNEINTLTDINLKIESSMITGIIGESGCGKTTLADIICGLVKQTSGQIYYNGENILKEKDFGYIFQNVKKQFFCETVYDEIKLSAKKFKYRLTEIEKRIKDVLKIVNLDESILSRNPMTLSNSNAKKVMLATTLIYNPKVIVLDEPTMNFDKTNKKEFINLMKLLKNRYNKTIIIISHDIDMIHKLVDNIVLINKGKVKYSLNKYELFKIEKNLKKYGLIPPKVILFSNKVLEKKNIKLGYRDELNDLLKDIFRNAR